MNPSDLDKPILLKGKYTIPAFTSVIVHGLTKKNFMLGQRLIVIVQASYAEDLANLPVGLYVQRVYTEMKEGSRSLSFVVRNSTSRPVQLSGGRIIARYMCRMLTTTPHKGLMQSYLCSYLMKFCSGYQAYQRTGT